MENYIAIIMLILTVGCNNPQTKDLTSQPQRAVQPAYTCDNGNDSFVLPTEYDDCVSVCDVVTATDTEPALDTETETVVDSETVADTDTEPDFFTIIVLPDTQNYVSWKPTIFNQQTQWIADNKDDLNVKMVVHVGDVVGNNNYPLHWERATTAMQTLDDADIPYSVSIGNHDQQSRDSTNFNATFPLSRFQDMGTFADVWSVEPTKADNTYHTFSHSGVGYLVLAIEFGPRDAVLSWASAVISAHQNHRVILSTHAYLDADGSRQLHSSYKSPCNGYGLADCNAGQEIWDSVIDDADNVDLVLCGHMSDDDGNGAELLTSTTQTGNTVYQMMTNYQYSSGSKGAFRILKFYADRVEASTYTPYYDNYITDSDNQFVILL